MKVFGITGRKNSGKTTLIEKLIAEFSRRGLRVSTIKHAHHDTDIDEVGRDSYRHRAAGAHQVILASHNRWALMSELRGQSAPELNQYLAHLDEVDLVLVEGYKASAFPKIEVWRFPDSRTPLARENETITALMSDQGDGGTGLPVIGINDITACADYISTMTGLVAKPCDNTFIHTPRATTSVEDVLAAIQGKITPITGYDEVQLIDAVGRVLAEDVIALLPQPAFTNSAVDGYAFAFDSVNLSLGSVPIAKGRAAAGIPYDGVIPAGEMLRILTGASLPVGADTVILQEDVKIDDGRLIPRHGNVSKGANVRVEGENIRKGSVIFASGHPLCVADIQTAASVGITAVKARPKLRVGVLSTGQEVVSTTPSSLASGAIPDANRPMLISALNKLGFAAVDLGICPDHSLQLKDMLDDASNRVDAIVTSGGISMGDEDHLARLAKSDAEFNIWQVAMKPGRPFGFGHWRRDDGIKIPLFALPGNPAATFISFLVLALPALYQCAGRKWQAPRGFQISAGFRLSKRQGRREYYGSRITPEDRVEIINPSKPTYALGSRIAEGLVELPEAACEINPGDMVRYIPFNAYGL